MKLLLFTLLSCFALNCSAQKVDTLSIDSKVLNESRKLIIYTPVQYEYAPNQKFEVIYVFDAQAREVFDMVQATMAFKNNNICPMIVVGVVSDDRNKDFLPANEFKETAESYQGHLGNAPNFLNFIGNELIPAVDKKYRTLSKRTAVGHSNGGTFISYSFLQKPDLFDAYIAVSPNFGYDKMQFVKRFKDFESKSLSATKFFYMCNAGGYPEEGDWITARNEIAGIFKSAVFKNKVTYKAQDFSATETHGSVFQIGVINGMKEYFDYQYFNSENLLNYYTQLKNQKIIDFNPQALNQLAYNFYYMKKTNDALQILLWSHQIFPQDLNLFDSIGEMYQNLNNKAKANEFYLLLDEEIERQKGTMKADEYQQFKDGVKGRINSLSNKK
jgi:predicted alpha/beta superfamily hydrolase